MITFIDEARFVTFTDVYLEMDRKVPRNKELHLWRRQKGTSLNSDSLDPKPLASSLYVRVSEARCPDKRSTSVMSLFPSGWGGKVKATASAVIPTAYGRRASSTRGAPPRSGARPSRARSLESRDRWGSHGRGVARRGGRGARGTGTPRNRARHRSPRPTRRSGRCRGGGRRRAGQSPSPG